MHASEYGNVCTCVRMCLSVSVHVYVWERKSPGTAVLLGRIPDTGHILQPLIFGKTPQGCAPYL